MIRIITTRTLARIRGANTRHEQRHLILCRRIADMEREAGAAFEREGRLRADNTILRQLLADHPQYRRIRAELKASNDRCAALDSLLCDLQAANEGAYRDSLAARLEVTPYTAPKQVAR